MKITQFSILILLLAGCATKSPNVVLPPATTDAGVSPASNKPMAKAKQTVDIPAEALEECAKLANIPSDNPTPEDVLKAKGKDVVMYRECSDRHKILVNVVKKAFNIK